MKPNCGCAKSSGSSGALDRPGKVRRLHSGDYPSEGTPQAGSRQGHRRDAGQLQVGYSEMGYRRCLTPSFSSPDPFTRRGSRRTGIVPSRGATRTGTETKERGVTGMAKRYSTSTVRSDGGIVPWLAAEGPLAYSPENPPESNYFFQYSW